MPFKKSDLENQEFDTCNFIFKKAVKVRKHSDFKGSLKIKCHVIKFLM